MNVRNVSESEREEQREKDRLASLGRERDILSKAGRRDQRAHVANARVFDVALRLEEKTF